MLRKTVFTMGVTLCIAAFAPRTVCDVCVGNSHDSVQLRVSAWAEMDRPAESRVQCRSGDIITESGDEAFHGGTNDCAGPGPCFVKDPPRV